MLRVAIAIVAGSLAVACASVAMDAPTVSAADLQRMVGDDWKGTLAYRDYSPPFGRVTLEVEAKIRATATGIETSLHYPREPKADGTSELGVSADGTMLDGERVVFRREDGDRLIIAAEAACEDDGKPATCRHEYTLAPREISWRKLVTFGDGTPVERNVYRFTR
jgi:hypothetical protein